MITSINPATGREIQRYEAYDDAKIASCLEAAAATAARWRDSSLAERAQVLRKAAELLEARRDRYARLMTEEMGKTLVSAEAEVDKCAWVCRHYADHGASYLRTVPVETDGSKSYVRFDPIGPVLAVMPWNFPFWQVFRFAAPAVMGGNVGLLKHASNVTGCSLAIEEVFRDAGLPAGGFQALVIKSGAVARVLEDDRVRAATLTGSEPAGAAVAGLAGKLIKKTVLELGGSDPFIVLADADVEKAATVGATARMLNTGQSCIAAKRFVVERPIADAFTEMFTARIGALKVGDPLERETDIGPLARGDLVTDLEDQVRHSVAHGARVILGGSRLDRPGYYYAPTVISHVEPGHAVGREETFGPVAAIIVVDDDADAIRVANGTEFGLGASLWTRDLAKAERLVPRIEAGAVFVNGLVKSDPRLPFGGVKRSGYGRELSVEGIREFLNIKTVWIA